MAYWSPLVRKFIYVIGLMVGLILAGCDAMLVDEPGSETHSLFFQVVGEAAPLGDQPEQSFYTVVSGPEEWEALAGSLPEAAIIAGSQAAADESNLILVIYGGPQPSSGHSIRVTGIYPQDGVYLVRVEEIQPGPEKITEPAMTLPYQIVALLRKEFAEGTNITFVFQDTQNKELATSTITTQSAYPGP